MEGSREMKKSYLSLQGERAQFELASNGKAKVFPYAFTIASHRKVWILVKEFTLLGRGLVFKIEGTYLKEAVPFQSGISHTICNLGLLFPPPPFPVVLVIKIGATHFDWEKAQCYSL